MKFHFLVGNDNGNSEQDIFVDGKLIRQPNVYAATGINPWGDDDIDVQKCLKNIYDNLVVSIISPAAGTGMFLVGRLALKTNGENVTSLYVKGNESKADQVLTYINALAVIAGRAVEKANEKGKLPNEISVKVDMAAALPVRQHTPEKAKVLRDKLMSGGTHKVTVHLGLSKAVHVDIKFEYVHVLSEGTPAVFALQMDSEGNWRSEGYTSEQKQGKLFEQFAKYYKMNDADGSYLDRKNILHVDCGDGTTDTPFTRGDAVDRELCGGVNNGVGHAINEAINDFLVKVPNYPNLSRQEFSDMLKSEHETRKHKFLNEAQQAFRPHSLNQVNQIIKHVNDQIMKIGPNDIDILAVYGGGSILLRNEMEPGLKELAEKNRFELLYVPRDYAVTLNAEGLDYFVRSEIYQALKPKTAASKE